VTANFVVSDVGPLVYESHLVDDDATPPSNGDGDGLVDCGETIELTVQVGNQGADAATGVNGTLSSSDANVSCTSSTSTYPDISGGGSAANDTAFVCTVGGGTPDGHTITFDLELTASTGGPWSDSFDLQVTCEGGATLDVAVSQPSDDAEERINQGTVIEKGSDLELVEDTTLQTVGLRFQNITIPKGALITEATITFRADEVHSGETHLTFHGQASDNAPTFVDTDGDISGRPKTAASVDWNNVPPWLAVHIAYETVDLAPVIQEIVNRPGWASGNALVIIVTGSGRRVAESYDGEVTMAPQLHVTYSGGTP
jgi:hypothetical protein